MVAYLSKLFTVTQKGYNTAYNFAKKGVGSINYGNRAANRIANASGEMSIFAKKRIMLESVRRNNPNFFYPAVGFCSGVPGGLTVGTTIALIKRLFR